MMHTLKKKTKGFIVTILIIIVIALIGLIIYANFFSQNGEQKKSTGAEKEYTGFENKYDNYTGDTNKDAGDQNNANDADGNRFNTSEKLRKSHSFKDLTISDLQIKSDYEYPEFATLTFRLTNNTSSKISNPILKFNFYSSDNKLLSEYEFPTHAILPPDVPITFSIDLRERVIDAYDFSFETLEESSVGGVG